MLSKFQTTDKKVIILDTLILSQYSDLIKTMFDNIEIDTNDIIPIQITSDCMEQIQVFIRLCEQNKLIIPKPLKGYSLQENIHISYIDFIDNIPDIYELLYSCDYMGIDILRDLCCAKLAIYIKNNIDNTDKISHFNISSHIIKKIEIEKSWV